MDDGSAELGFNGLPLSADPQHHHRHHGSFDEEEEAALAAAAQQAVRSNSGEVRVRVRFSSRDGEDHHAQQQEEQQEAAYYARR